MTHFEDGWYFGVGSEITQDETGARIPNVVGRFRDHEKIDGVASRAANGPVYKTVLNIETKARIDASGFPGRDISAETIDPDADPRSAAGRRFEAVKARFPSAWADYISKKEAAQPAAKPARKPRAKKQPDNVVALNKASA